MVNTPWPNNEIEDPHIYASHDGLSWEVPPGQMNPLDMGGSNFNSDCELLYVDGTLHALWRGQAGTKLWYRSTTDGTTWTPRTEITGISYDGGTVGLSPCLVWDGTLIHLWSGVSGSESNGSVWDEYYGRWRRVLAHRTAPTLDGPWSAPDFGHVWNGAFERSDHWHQGITLHDGVFYGCFGGGEIGWGGGGPWAAFASSTDGVTWNAADQRILQSVPGTWFSGNIYRPSIRVERSRARIWFGAQEQGTGRSETGYTEVPASWLPEPPA